MNIWINYHHLFYFKTIAEEGSVSKAAEKLRLGQPTLSAQLKLFEETLGVQLFERKNKRLFLTEHGRVALDYAKNIFKMGSELYEVLHDRHKPLKPTLHIGALDSIAKQILLKVVKHTLKSTPCQITISEGPFDHLLRELVGHRMDLVLTNFLPTGLDARGLFHKTISKNNVCLYGALKFKHLTQGFPASLSNQPLIVPTYDSKLRQDIDHWAMINKIDLNIVAETQDISVAKLMAIQGLGVIPIAKHSASEQIKGKVLFELGHLTSISEEIHLLFAQRKIANPIASLVKDEFKLS